MPDSAGEGFPNNVQVGHEHLHLSTGFIYQYLGGTPSNPNSWIQARGVHVAAHMYSIVNQASANTNPTLVTFSSDSMLHYVTWDSVGLFTIQVPGMYTLTSNGQIAVTGLAVGQQRRLSMWFRKNGVDIGDSPVTNSVSGNLNDMRVVRNYRVEELFVGDTIQLMMEIETAGIGLGLYVGNTNPGTVSSPSAKLSMVWVPL